MDREPFPGDASDLADEFVVLNRYLSAGETADKTLRRLVDLAVTSIPRCQWAAVTAWPPDRRPYSLATSAEVADQVDQLQYDLQEGPCLRAVTQAPVITIADVGTEDRWPALTAAIQATSPVRSVLSFHLVDEPRRSALNLYAGRPGVWDQEAMSTAALFAAHARVLLIHASRADEATHLGHALATSRQIGMAVGILMNAHKVTGDDAFRLLRNASQNLNRKLRDIAVEVTETGALPETPQEIL